MAVDEPQPVMSWPADGGRVTVGGSMARQFLDALSRIYNEGCGCWVCNPLVKPREKIGAVCPSTGLGFIGPQRAEDVAGE